MDEKARRRMRLLEANALITTPLVVILSLAAFLRAPQQARFEVIDVERINVREKNGTLRLTIANRARMPDPVIGGKSYPLRGGTGAGSAGLIFFNDQGNESGGLSFAGADTGRRPSASGMITFDQLNQNEAIALSYAEVGGRRTAGLSILDQPAGSIQPVAESLMAIRALPDGPAKEERMRRLRDERARSGAGAQRVFVGKREDRSATLVLADPRGRQRLRLVVDSLGAARIEFLNDAGRVTHQLPDSGR